jgi:hypothetical protein
MPGNGTWLTAAEVVRMLQRRPALASCLKTSHFCTRSFTYGRLTPYLDLGSNTLRVRLCTTGLYQVLGLFCLLTVPERTCVWFANWKDLGYYFGLAQDSSEILPSWKLPPFLDSWTPVCRPSPQSLFRSVTLGTLPVKRTSFLPGRYHGVSFVRQATLNADSLACSESLSSNRRLQTQFKQSLPNSSKLCSKHGLSSCSRDLHRHGHSES